MMAGGAGEGDGGEEGQGALPGMGEAQRPVESRADQGKPGRARPHYHGHRDRLRARFLEGGAAALAEYELLELLLFQAIPRRDVKPLAKRLIARYGTLGDLLGAETETLLADPELSRGTVVALKSVAAAALALSRHRVLERPLLANWQALLDYCHAAMAHAAREQFRVIFLDSKNRVIADEIQQTGTVNHTPLYPREVVRRAVALDATALVLVHNHPSGDPQPSRADIDMTRQVVEAARGLGISVHDHLIVGREATASFKELGLL